MCVITKYRLFDKTPMRHFAIGGYAGPRLTYTQKKKVVMWLMGTS